MTIRELLEAFWVIILIAGIVIMGAGCCVMAPKIDGVINFEVTEDEKGEKEDTKNGPQGSE